jgi:hypothetical protein
MQQTYRQSGCVHYSDCADFADLPANNANANFMGHMGLSTYGLNHTGTFN